MLLVFSPFYMVCTYCPQTYYICTLIVKALNSIIVNFEIHYQKITINLKHPKRIIVKLLGIY